MVGVADAEAVEERELRPDSVDVSEGVEEAQPEGEGESRGEADAEGEAVPVFEADGVRVAAPLRVPLRVPVPAGVQEVEGDPEEVAAEEVVRAALRVTPPVGESLKVADTLSESRRLEGDTEAEPEVVPL